MLERDLDKQQEKESIYYFIAILYGEDDVCGQDKEKTTQIRSVILIKMRNEKRRPDYLVPFDIF